MEPSIYLSEKGNKARSENPFIESKIKDVHNFASYKDTSEMNQEEVIEILKEKGSLLKFINNPTENMILAALTQEEYAIYYVKEVSESIIDKLIKKDRHVNKYDRSFPYTLVYINNINLEYINKIIKESYSFYGIKINMLDKITILDILKETGGSNLSMFIEQKDSFSKEDFTYIIDNLLEYKIEKRLVIKSRILTRLYDKKECQCDELCIAAIKLHWQNYQGVKIKSKAVYLECLKYNNRYTKDLLKFGVSIEEILSINGLALKYIENPTTEQIIIAIKQNGKAIEFVKDKTEELCLMAVEQDGLALRYIESPSLNVSVTASKNHPKAIMLLDKSLRPEIREELKNQTFKLNDVTVTKKDVLVRLELIKKINLKIYNLYKECFEKDISYTPLQMMDLCLKDIIKKFPISEVILKNIIRNQLDIIAYDEKDKKEENEKLSKTIKSKPSLEKRLYNIFTFNTIIIGTINGNKIELNGETFEYELPDTDVDIGNGVRRLKRIQDRFLLEYGQEDLNINFKDVE